MTDSPQPSEHYEAANGPQRASPAEPTTEPSVEGPQAAETASEDSEDQPAPVHHSVWNMGDQPTRQAAVGTGWASAFFPPAPIQGGASPAIPRPNEKKNAKNTPEGVLNTLEHKLANLQQDLAHSWGHLNEWKKRLVQDQSDATLRTQDLDNKEKLANQLVAELQSRKAAIERREAELDRLDADVDARLREIGQSEVDKVSEGQARELLTLAKRLESREAEAQRASAEYDDMRVELEGLRREAVERCSRVKHDHARVQEVHGELRAREAELQEQSQALTRERAAIERRAREVNESEQRVAQREHALQVAQADLEDYARELEKRWEDLTRSEVSLRQRGAALERFGGVLQQAIDSYGGDADSPQPSSGLRSRPSAAPPAAGRGALSESLHRARSGIEQTLRALEGEADSQAHSQALLPNEAPAPGPPAYDPGVPPVGGLPPGSTDDQVLAADSLNTHLFRRIRHNR